MSCLDDIRSIVSVYGHILFVQSFKKQEVVSRGSTESGYRSLANLTFDVVWLKASCV